MKIQIVDVNRILVVANNGGYINRMLNIIQISKSEAPEPP
jgi:hypothetical protein